MQPRACAARAPRPGRLPNEQHLRGCPGLPRARELPPPRVGQGPAGRQVRGAGAGDSSIPETKRKATPHTDASSLCKRTKEASRRSPPRPPAGTQLQGAVRAGPWPPQVPQPLTQVPDLLLTLAHSRPPGAGPRGGEGRVFWREAALHTLQWVRGPKVPRGFIPGCHRACWAQGLRPPASRQGGPPGAP